MVSGEIWEKKLKDTGRMFHTSMIREKALESVARQTVIRETRGAVEDDHRDQRKTETGTNTWKAILS